MVGSQSTGRGGSFLGLSRGLGQAGATDPGDHLSYRHRRPNIEQWWPCQGRLQVSYLRNQGGSATFLGRGIISCPSVAGSP